MAPSEADKNLWLQKLNEVVGTKIELSGQASVPATCMYYYLSGLRVYLFRAFVHFVFCCFNHMANWYC